MDKVVDLIGRLSIDDEVSLKHLQNELKKTDEIIVKNIRNIDSGIHALDPITHSLGLMYLLTIKGNLCETRDEAEVFINQCVRFLTQCVARQVRLDPKRFRILCQKFLDVCIETKQTIRAIKPLKESIWKIGPGDLLTPQHAMFVQACILAKCYKAAQPVLDKFVFEIDPTKTGIESVDTRLYFYFGGVVYVGLKKFEKALEFFDIVISAPALVGSVIMVEAYKKNVLVSLILKGEIPGLPKYANSGLVSLFKKLAQPYEEFANAFSTRSVEELHKVAANHHELFTSDGNMGLVKQVIQALYRQNIQRLTKTYLTLSLKDIGEQVNLTDTKETERRIFDMIKTGAIFAKINQKDGMVEFLDDTEQHNSDHATVSLDQLIQTTMNLTSKVKEIDEQVSLNSKYLQKSLQAERGGTGPSGRAWHGGDEEMDLDNKGGFFVTGFRG